MISQYHFLKKSLVIFLFSIFIFSAIPIGHAETTQTIKIGKKKWVNGIYAQYTLQFQVFNETARKEENFDGKVEFHVWENKVVVEVLVPKVYHKTINFDIKNGKTYYNGNIVVLPFFYTGNKVISYYNENYENITKIVESSMNLHSGIVYGRPCYQASVNVIYWYNASVVKNFNIYDFDKSTGLLFGGVLGYSILLQKIFNIGQPPYVELIKLSLSDTNIQLSSVNKGGLLAYYSFFVIPIIIIVAVFGVFVYLYKRSHRRKEYERDYRQRRRKKLR